VVLKELNLLSAFFACIPSLRQRESMETSIFAFTPQLSGASADWELQLRRILDLWKIV
jgi:hypothetical protein